MLKDNKKEHSKNTKFMEVVMSHITFLEQRTEQFNQKERHIVRRILTRDMKFSGKGNPKKPSTELGMTEVHENVS